MIPQSRSRTVVLGYLPGGAYYDINTELFNVITKETVRHQDQGELTEEDLEEMKISVDNTGVVIALEGEAPSQEPNAVGRVVAGHHNYRLPWVFLDRGGQRGVQEETLDGGSNYAINPWFARVVQVPIRDLHLEWTRKSQKNARNYDSALDLIVVDIQGHRLSLEMSQILRIPPSAAPRLVRRFGEGGLDTTRSAQSGPVVKPAPVQRFVERVLGATVAGYFTEIVGGRQVMEFIIEYDKIRMQLQDQVTQALNDWDVVAGRTVLGEFKSEDRALNELRRLLARQDIGLTQEIRRHKHLEQAKKNREIEAEIRRVEIELKGESEVVVLRKQIELLGPYQVVIDRVLGHMEKMPVPHYVSGGGDRGDMAEQILRLMPFANVQEMLKSLLQNYDNNQEPTAQQYITGASIDQDTGQRVDTLPPEESGAGQK